MFEEFVVIVVKSWWILRNENRTVVDVSNEIRKGKQAHVKKDVDDDDVEWIYESFMWNQ